jgi:catechol 2,3-dioxygenase-like lactoylglutathione lyase family enzyme
VAEHDRSEDGNRLTHIGVCVADLERSLAFYGDALGFVEVGRLSVADDEESGRLLGVDGLDVELVYMERDGVRIELLWYRQPGHSGDVTPRPMNLLGLTHFAFRVGDLDALCRRIEEAGGHVLTNTTAVFAQGNRGIMAVDPDGTRIELIERPEG